MAFFFFFHCVFSHFGSHNTDGITIECTVARENDQIDSFCLNPAAETALLLIGTTAKNIANIWKGFSITIQTDK